MEAHAHRRVRAEAGYAEGKDPGKGKDGHPDTTTTDGGGLENKMGGPGMPPTGRTTASGMDNTMETGYSQAIRRLTEGGSDRAPPYAHGGNRPKRMARIDISTRNRTTLPLRGGNVNGATRRPTL